MSTNAQGIIPVVALGVYRNVAAALDAPFSSTPFRLVAILDLMTPPRSIIYNPQNLLTVLHNLHPRPQVFISGAAINGAITRESIKVWEEYVRVTGVEGTEVINLHDEPPPGGDWMSHIMRKLKARYVVA